jgi:hypothetical protein
MVFSFLGSSPPHFQIKLNTHGSNLNSILVIMSDLKLFFSTGVLTQYSTLWTSYNLLKKIKTSNLDRRGHIEGDIMEHNEQKKKQ